MQCLTNVIMLSRHDITTQCHDVLVQCTAWSKNNDYGLYTFCASGSDHSHVSKEGTDWSNVQEVRHHSHGRVSFTSYYIICPFCVIVYSRLDLYHVVSITLGTLLIFDVYYLSVSILNIASPTEYASHSYCGMDYC